MISRDAIAVRSQIYMAADVLKPICKTDLLHSWFFTGTLLKLICLNNV